MAGQLMLHLPVEPAESVSATALDALSRTSAFTLNPYRISSSDFEIAENEVFNNYAGVYLSTGASGGTV